MSTQLAIYGSGGFAREVAWLAEQCSGADGDVVVNCFIDDGAAELGRVLNDIPVLDLPSCARRFPQALVVCAVGDPRLAFS